VYIKNEHVLAHTANEGQTDRNMAHDSVGELSLKTPATGFLRF